MNPRPTRRGGSVRRFRHLIAIGALVAGFVSTSVWIINSSAALRHALTIANARSPWTVAVGDFEWSPLRNTIHLETVAVEHPAEGKRIDVERVDLSYRPLGFLRGKLVIDELTVEGVRLVLPAAAREEREPKKRRRIDLARLILLRSLEIQEGTVQDVAIGFGEAGAMRTDTIRFALEPSLFGGTTFSLQIAGLDAQRGGTRLASAGLIALSTSTNLSRWTNSFPYANALSGELSLQGAMISGLPIETLDAALLYRDALLKLTDLRLAIGKHTLAGGLEANVAEERFDLTIEIDQPLALPHFGRDLRTLETAGALGGRVHLSGTGFDIPKSSGRGEVALTHRFDADPEAPIAVESAVSWRGGVLALENARARLGEGTLAVAGTIDIPHKRIALTAEGEGVPIGAIFGKFKNPHLARIFGRADVEGSFTGWGKDFRAEVAGTVFDGGWQPIVAERIAVELGATYDELTLVGDIFTGEEKTGHADLVVQFGGRGADGTRSKRFTLDAQVTKHPLQKTLATYDLAGNATGQIALAGPSQAFTGEATVAVERGSWHGVPFEEAGARIGLTRRQLVFDDLRLIPQGLAPLALPGTIVADLPDGRLELTGEPRPGLRLDATYAYAGKRWTIDEITWGDEAGGALRATGRFTAGGSVDLHITGAADFAAIRPLAVRVLDGRGPFEIDLRATGQTSNPRLDGFIAFRESRLLMRRLGLSVEEASGALRFAGSRIVLDDVHAESGGGTVELGGWIEHRGLTPAAVDLTLDATSMIYRFPDRSMTVEFEGQLSLAGAMPSPLLAGDITILDGRYTKDFKILEVIGRARRPEPRPEPPPIDPRLELTVRNSGEMEIDNNIGNIWLAVNIDVGGRLSDPVVAGAISVTDGEVHYLGINFDITKGFVEFRERYAAPYIEIHAENEINVYNVTLALYGPTDNLKLDLAATSPSGPLEKRDVVSLLIFGVTEQERLEAAERTGGRYTAGMVAQSISGVLERPVTKFTKLDVFRLEAAEPGSETISRVYIGKQVSDRLTVNLSTDIDTEDAVQTIIAEYLITDNLLLKGAQASDGDSEISGIIRFRLR